MNYALKQMGLFRSKGTKGSASNPTQNVKNKTIFIKMLTEDANTLVSQAKTPEIKADVNRVYEAVRFSNPMSSDILSDVETKITIKFSELQDAVAVNDASAVQSFANEMLVLVKERNNKCKLLK